MTKMKPLHGKIIVKLELASVRQSKAGIIYDEVFRQKSYAFGHVYQIDDDISKKHGLRLGDRIVFEKDRVETVTYNSKETASIIDVVLVFIHPNDVLATVDEERTVMDFLSTS